MNTIRVLQSALSAAAITICALLLACVRGTTVPGQTNPEMQSVSAALLSRAVDRIDIYYKFPDIETRRRLDIETLQKDYSVAVSFHHEAIVRRERELQSLLSKTSGEETASGLEPQLAVIFSDAKGLPISRMSFTHDCGHGVIGGVTFTLRKSICTWARDQLPMK